ncbi:uncharacterized mitochondrial protein AtMg00820-like [Humulus lupulus]|uniref:uncharacterized mitochondrial protein AtMg00820-like n=1 Tax=Humulus lupulus TaxID=3486 RepID=UPI002B412496|nr:uncharacterized mitochondrial protein AtMg00820-like [Humulus lupulus]
MITRAKSGIFRPKLVSSILDRVPIEPSCFTEANKHQVWKAAMQQEITSLNSQGTWNLVSPPQDAKIIGCKWVYKVKLHADGTVERYKARLVSKGYHQTHGLDFHETFSLVIKPTTIRLVLNIAVSRHWAIKQLDIQNAFLLGDLAETV